MDMSDSYHRGHGEELSKTDFFDFVVSPDTNADAQLSLNRTLKSMGIYIDNNAAPSSELADPYKLVDAQNSLGDDGQAAEHAFWASTCDKEAVRLDSEMLADLDKFCWTPDGDLLGGGRGDGTVDTDGAIYTLTVLNGDHSTAAWYRGKELDSAQAPGVGQATLDLDSILSIIPTGEHYQESFEASLPAFGGDKPDYASAFDDSGYASKEAVVLDNNNTADWKNHNVECCTQVADADNDSLLRSALQGVTRYASAKKEEREDVVLPFPASGASVPGADSLLSTLDAASEPGDFETLRRIAREVAESAGRFCLDNNPCADNQAFTQPPNTHQLAEQLSSPPRKKASRSKTPKSSTSTPSTLTSTPGGGVNVGSVARKERSLHHCHICAKGFKDKYSVNVHVRTHTGEKPFACSLCGKAFRQKAHLAKHYQTHVAQKHAANAQGAVTKGSGHKRCPKAAV